MCHNNMLWYCDHALIVVRQSHAWLKTINAFALLKKSLIICKNELWLKSFRALFPIMSGITEYQIASRSLGSNNEATSMIYISCM